jgi:hypothetical protein
MGIVSLRFIAESDYDIGSDLIRYYGHGAYSHVDITLPDGSFLGARHDGGVQIRPHSYLNPAIETYVSLSSEDSVENAFLTLSKKEIGKQYNTTAIIAFEVGRD